MKIKKFYEFSELNEKNALFRTGHHTYEIITMRGDNGPIRIKASEEGIIADNGKHLSWDNIEELKRMFKI